MGIFSNLFGKPTARQPLLGNTEPVCPHCSAPLEKMPGRKKKCPSCGNFIFVRTRPADRTRVLVTQRDAQEIDDQWSMEQGTYQGRKIAEVEQEKEFKTQEAALAARYGKPPPRGDVVWALFNKRLMEHSESGNWGFYRNTRFEMAEMLANEKRHRPALDTYLEVSYLDANGPCNISGYDLALRLELGVVPFDRDQAFQAPGVAARIQRLADTLAMTRSDLRAAFLSVAFRIQPPMKLPVEPEVAWADLEASLEAGG